MLTCADCRTPKVPGDFTKCELVCAYRHRERTIQRWSPDSMTLVAKAA